MGTSMTGHIAPSLPQFNGTPAISGNGQRYPPNTIGQSGSSAAVHPSTPFMGLTNQGTAPSPTPLMNNMLRPQMSNFTQVSSGTTQYQQLQIPIVSSGASLAAQYTSPGHQLNFQQAGQPSAHTSEYYQNAQVRSQNQDQQVSADQYNNIQAIAPNYNQLGSGYAQAGGSFHQQINPQSSNFNHPQSSFGHESGGQPSGSYHQVAAQYSQQPIANNQQQSSAYTQSASGQPSGSYAQQPGSYVPQNSYRQQSGSYGQTPAAATSGIDSRQMPRPDQVHALDQKFYESTSYHPDHCSGYPYTWTDYYGYDAGGQSHPRFIRSSLREIPSNQDTLAISGMTPIGLVITPFATLRPEEAAVPLVGDMKMPIRCDKCRAYMNPFCKFIDNGRKFICPLCSATSLIPESYVCALDPSTGRRIDAYQRAELSFGTFDLFAPKVQ